MNINILDYFEATVKKHPQKIAIMDHCQAYSDDGRFGKNRKTNQTTTTTYTNHFDDLR